MLPGWVRVEFLVWYFINSLMKLLVDGMAKSNGDGIVVFEQKRTRRTWAIRICQLSTKRSVWLCVVSLFDDQLEHWRFKRFLWNNETGWGQYVKLPLWCICVWVRQIGKCWLKSPAWLIRLLSTRQVKRSAAEGRPCAAWNTPVLMTLTTGYANETSIKIFWKMNIIN